MAVICYEFSFDCSPVRLFVIRMFKTNNRVTNKRMTNDERDLPNKKSGCIKAWPHTAAFFKYRYPFRVIGPVPALFNTRNFLL